LSGPGPVRPRLVESSEMAPVFEELLADRLDGRYPGAPAGEVAGRASGGVNA
jgi:hypothetical protein